MTDYLVLKAADEDRVWEIEAINIKASSARRAIAAADVNAGIYVAIPSRSWKPLVVKVEQTTKVTIG